MREVISTNLETLYILIILFSIYAIQAPINISFFSIHWRHRSSVEKKVK